MNKNQNRKKNRTSYSKGMENFNLILKDFKLCIFSPF